MTDLDDLTPEERMLASSLRRQLRSGDALDFVAASQVRAARARALAGAAAPFGERHRWLVAGSAAVAVMLVAVLTFTLRDGLQPGSQEAGGQLDTLEVMTDDMDTEFYEDLDLYEWLARAPDGTA